MNPVIHADALTKIFGTNTAVDQISFDVRSGEIFGFSVMVDIECL